MYLDLGRISSICHCCHKNLCLCPFFLPSPPPPPPPPLSRLDYCKSPLSGSPQYLLNKIQKVQNNTACFVLRVLQTGHISSYILLRTDQWIQYKLASQCLNSTDPGYLPELKIYKPTRQLCSSSNTSVLCLPFVHRHSLGHRSFYLLTYLGLFLIPHRVWNLTISLVKLGH